MLVILSGPSSVGKSFAVEYFTRHYHFQSIVPYTTRSPRISESEGIHYHFKSISELKSISSNFGKGYWAQPLNGNWYGYTSHVDQLAENPKNWIIQAYSDIAIEIKKNNPDSILVFLEYFTQEEMEFRIQERFPDKTDFNKRISHANHELSLKQSFDYVIANNNPEELVKKISDFVLPKVIQTPYTESLPGPLSDFDIKKSINSLGGIRISGLPNNNYDEIISGWGIDLSLASKIYKIKRRLLNNFFVFDLKYGDDKQISKKFIEKVYDQNEGILLRPNEFILASTNEKIQLPDNIVSLISGRSSYSRLGISVELSQILLQPGHNDTIPLQIRNCLPYPILIYPNTPIAQLAFFRLITKSDQSYEERSKSKYLGTLDDIRSKYYLDDVYMALKANSPNKKQLDWDQVLNFSLIVSAVLFLVSWLLAKYPNPEVSEIGKTIDIYIILLMIVILLVRIFKFFKNKSR